MAAVALTTDACVLTSVANDYGFERIFARQIEALGRAGDVARCDLDEWGGSANVIEAVREALRRILRTVALTGRDGGALGGLVQVAHQRAARDDLQDSGGAHDAPPRDLQASSSARTSGSAASPVTMSGRDL